MPPITSPRRPPFHAPAVPIPGAHGQVHSIPSGSTPTTLGSTPPSTGTSPGSFGRNGHHLPSMAGLPGMHSTPYMVALSGWPEPVFVAEKRSRPTTPPDNRDGIGIVKQQLEPLSREVRDGAPMPSGISMGFQGIGMSRTLSGSRIDPSTRSRVDPTSRSRDSSPGPPTFPTSSARDSPLDGSSGTPPGPLSGPLARLALSSHHSPTANNNVRPRPRPVSGHGFQDPRYSMNAGVLGRRSLRVAPAWTSATPQHGQAPYPTSNGDTHTHPHPHPPRVVVGAGKRTSCNINAPMNPPPPPQRVTGAVPDVVPPPSTAATTTALTATPTPTVTQVYPRDPDSPYAWRGGSAGDSPGSASPGGQSPVTVAQSPVAAPKTEVEMDVDKK